jgi:hypothetical protein
VGTKQQLSPRALGLLDLPAGPLRAGSISLIDRRPDWEGPPRSEAVPLADALISLVPELSYLSHLQHPLQRLAQLISELGGVNRISYAEAESIDVNFLDDLLEADHREYWAPVSASEHGDVIPPDSYVRVDALDGVTVGDVMLLLHGTTVRVLDGIGPAVWEGAGRPATLEEITRFVELRHGSPAVGAALPLVEAAVESLVEAGILRRG